MSFKIEPQMELEQFPKTRKAWTKEEDEVLMQCIQAYGVGHWATIAQALREQTGIQRSTKQCRNRWMNTLDPNVNKLEWTADEEQLIYDLQKQVGNKWAEIAKHLNGRLFFFYLIIYRTDNAVKNHWYSTMRKRLRKLYKYIGDEFNKKPEIKRLASEFMSIDYKKYTKGFHFTLDL